MGQSLLSARRWRPHSIGVDINARLILACLILVISLPQTLAGNDTTPTSMFRSRPDLEAPILDVGTKDAARVTPGYFFITPYQAPNPGPYIYDNDGNLVWSGFGNAGPQNSHNLQVCSYHGEDHLCFFQGNQMLGYCRGHGVVMDSSYRIVRSVQAGGGMPSSDMHEFKLLGDGKTALMTIYRQRQWDMSRWGITNGMGWVLESVFQELETDTSKVLYEWRSLDHVDPSTAYTQPASTDVSGDGLTKWSPWDYFHINSVDKDENGDYLISARHTNSVYKVSGQNGHIMWTLRGSEEGSDFSCIDFSFAMQHDARWISQNDTHTILSLYNNGDSGYHQWTPVSTGMIIVIHHTNRTARLIKEYGGPGDGISSASQGNMQILPNKNVVMGWGKNAFLSEHAANGDIVFFGGIATSNIMHYRVYKFPWIGKPVDVPSMWTYARTNSSATAFYVSWNGATEVKFWTFYGSKSRDGPFVPVATIPKSGFETIWKDIYYHAFTFAEALDVNEKSLANSTVAATTVPGEGVETGCEEMHCDAYVDPDAEKEPEEEHEEEGEHEDPEPEKLNLTPWQYVYIILGCLGAIILLSIALMYLWRCWARRFSKGRYIPITLGHQTSDDFEKHPKD